MLYLLQTEADLVTVEVDILGGPQSMANAQVVFHSDNDASYTLARLGKVIHHITHIPLDLSHDTVTGTAFLEFDDEQLLAVLANGQDTDGAGIAGVLLAYQFRIFLQV